MKNISKREVLKFSAFILLALGLLIAGHALHLEEKISMESLRDSLSKTGAWQFVLFAAIYCASALIPFPTAALSSASGALWGPYLGTVMTVISATLAACIPFVLARVMARKAVRKLIEQNSGASRCDRFAGRNGFITVLTMRLIPIVPWDLVNYLSGLCSIRFRDYLLGSLLGTIPASFAYNLIGASLGGTVDKKAIAAVAVVTILFAIVMAALKKRSATE